MIRGVNTRSPGPAAVSTVTGMAVDARGRLVEDPFSYRVTKDGTVLISRSARLVVTVAGPTAERLVAWLANASDEDQVQQLLARATDNYRRGNERR
jgi:hypothetical protein